MYVRDDSSIAYDYMLRFDRDFNGFETIGTAYGMMALCGTACGVELARSQEEIEALPNGSELLSIYPEEERKAASERMKKLRKERGSEWRKR